MSNSHSRRHRIIPLIVACPLFLQNLDTFVMAAALPSIAKSLQISVLDLNLAITSYVLSLAVSLPASAWLAGRFGARRVFCAAVLLFSLGSALCGMAHTLGELIGFRLLQGIGGGMMVPVGRRILLQTAPAAELVSAMVWFTIPGAVGRLAGPLLGGAIVSVTSWQWIFLVNIPFGILGVLLALRFIGKDIPGEPEAREPFDFMGLAMLASAFGGLLGGMEIIGKSIIPGWAIAGICASGLLALYLYVHRSRAMAHPLLDFTVLRFPTFRIVLFGGFPIRIAIGAAPFLLPLMLQVGFGLSPMKSGLLTMGMAVGSLSTRAAMRPAIKTIGFRRLMVACAILTAGFYAVYGLLKPQISHPLMFCLFFLGGLFTSMTMVSLNTLGYSDIPAARTGHATALSAMAQQLSLAIGIVTGAALVSMASHFHGNAPAALVPADFGPAFMVIAALALWSAAAFRRLRPEDGEAL